MLNLSVSEVKELHKLSEDYSDMLSARRNCYFYRLLKERVCKQFTYLSIDLFTIQVVKYLIASELLLVNHKKDPTRQWHIHHMILLFCLNRMKVA